MAPKTKAPQVVTLNPNSPQSAISPADLAAANAPTTTDASPAPPDLAAITSPAPATTGLPPDIVRSMITNPDKDPTAPIGTPPTLAPKPPGFLSKLGTGVQKALPIIGAIGGAMEAAGSPRHEAPSADRLARINMQMGQLGFEKERLQKVEEPMAQAHSKYFEGLGSQYDLVPAGVDANGDPIMVPKRAAGQVAAAGVNAASREKVEGMRVTGQESVARIRAGAPVQIDSELATLAGQPQLAGQGVSGATLTNFVKVLGAKGYKVQDLGNDGLWVIDRGGQRVKQISVSSPSIARGEAYARARATYTPVNVFDENGNLTAVSQMQQLQGGIPSAQTVFSEQGPTAASRTMAQSANTLIQPYTDEKGVQHKGHVDELRDFVLQNENIIGPIAGRVDAFLSGRVGSTGNAELDYNLGKLRGSYTLVKGALARTHFGGRSGVQAAQYFSDLMGAQNSAMGIAGVLDSTKPYLQGYSEMQNFTPQKVAAAAPAGGGKKTTPKNRPPLTNFEK